MLRRCALLFGLLVIGAARVAAATPLDGVWSGMLDFGSGHPLLFVITISHNGGTLSATAASPYQGGGAIAVDTIAVNGNNVTFSIKKLDVSYSGTIAADAIDGSFTQFGKTAPLVLAPSSLGTATLAGTWLGTLSTAGGNLLLALHIRNAGGTISATLDSPYQQGFGIPVSTIAASDGTLTFAMPNLGASFTGKIEPHDVDGTFSQRGETFPLKFVRP